MIVEGLITAIWEYQTKNLFGMLSESALTESILSEGCAFGDALLLGASRNGSECVSVFK